MWLVVFFSFIIRFFLDLDLDFPLFHNMISFGFGFLFRFFCSNLCTNAFITIERFSFNVFFLHSPSMYPVHTHKISFLALINFIAPCPRSELICVFKHSISHVWNLT